MRLSLHPPLSPPEPLYPPEECHVLLTGELLVDRERLRGDTDPGARFRPIVHARVNLCSQIPANGGVTKVVKSIAGLRASG